MCMSADVLLQLLTEMVNIKYLSYKVKQYSHLIYIYIYVISPKFDRMVLVMRIINLCSGLLAGYR